MPSRQGYANVEQIVDPFISLLCGGIEARAEIGKVPTIERKMGHDQLVPLRSVARGEKLALGFPAPVGAAAIYLVPVALGHGGAVDSGACWREGSVFRCFFVSR